MATERQIEANRRNAARSTGPRTDEGKARSRGNATTHGLAGESDDVAEAARNPAFLARRAAWAEEYRPSGDSGGWALDRAVAASLRIERCERAVDELVERTARRATLAWAEDHYQEAANLAAGIARAPERIARRLASTYHGVSILIETWDRLGASLEAEGGGGWTEAECSIALDLLGVPARLRRGPTPIDDPDRGDLLAFRRALVAAEVARLEESLDSLAELDDFGREQASRGDVALLGPEARLLLRYERDAWRRYRESLGEVRSPTPTPTPAPALAPPGPVAPAPPPPPPPPAPPSPSLPPASKPRDVELERLLLSRGPSEAVNIQPRGIVEAEVRAAADLPSPVGLADAGTNPISR